MLLPENQQLRCWWDYYWGWRSRMLKRPWKETYRKNTDIHEQKIIKKKQDIGRTETLTYKQKTEIKESCDLSKFLQIICVSNINPGQGKLCQHTHTHENSWKQASLLLKEGIFLFLLRHKNIPWRVEVVIAWIKPSCQYLLYTLLLTTVSLSHGHGPSVSSLGIYVLSHQVSWHWHSLKTSLSVVEIYKQYI